jgi:multidrug efflux system membrane fusion protein
MTTATFLSGLAVPIRRHPWRSLLLFLLALGVIGAVYYVAFYTRGSSADPAAAAKTGKRGPGADMPQPITVGAVAVKDMPVWLPGLGTVVPSNLAVVRARVDGLLTSIHFTEGQTVKAGALLAEIDSAPFQAQLAQASGQLARDTALLENARLDLSRYRDLWRNDSIARQQLDTQEALVRQYEGAVENDRGVVASAKLQVDYTRVTAPVSGRVGLRQVDPGNQVHAADANGIVSIAQVQPITVVFAVPETQVSRISRRMAEGELTAEAWDREQKNLLGKGHLLTTDNQIDPTTGTIKLKAVFANTDNQLFPNQFVNARLLLGTRKDATVVPAAAVLRGSQGSFVYTVDAENMVKAVPVMPGITDGNLTIVEGALQPGNRVVLDGSDSLRDGARVEIITAEQRQQAQASTDGKQGHGKRREGGAAPAAGEHPGVATRAAEVDNANGKAATDQGGNTTSGTGAGASASPGGAPASGTGENRGDGPGRNP